MLMDLRFYPVRKKIKMNNFEPETIEEHVYGEVLADRILEAKREGLLQDSAEEE